MEKYNVVTKETQGNKIKLNPAIENHKLYNSMGHTNKADIENVCLNYYFNEKSFKGIEGVLNNYFTRIEFTSKANPIDSVKSKEDIENLIKELQNKAKSFK